MDLGILAIVCVRNEQIHIRRCLTHLIQDGIDVVLLDNGSTDATLAIAQEFLGRGLVFIEPSPWTGSFSLLQVLTAKQKIAMSTDYDWFIHADADEWLCAPRRGETLATAIARADREGFTCINFHELAFVPIEGEDFEAEDYSSRMTTYYFFQPYYPRLMRGWKAGAGLDNVETGGHMVGGEQRRVCPEDFYLRHYISLSESYVRRKYLYRKFSEEGLARGWHKNRLSIPPENLRVRPVPGMRSLPHAASMEFDLSQPFTKHFWQW